MAFGALRPAWVEAGDQRLLVRTGGRRAGVPVVLVHGVIVSSRYLLPLGDELARSMPVVVPDLPGFGHSTGSGAPPAVDVLAEAVVAAARALGHERVALVGNSFGAQVAVEAALRHPAVVARLALLGPTVDPAAPGFVRQAGRWVRNAPGEHPSSVPVMARDLVDAGARRATAAVRAMLADRIEEKLGSVACEVLVVRGARDRTAPRAWCEHAAALVPGGRGSFAELSAGAHMAHYARVLEMAAVLRPFLAVG